MRDRLRKTRGVLWGFMTTLLLVFSATGLAAQDYEFSGLNIAPGSSESTLNFAWFGSSSVHKPVIEIAKKSDQKGNVFPVAKAKSFTGTVSKVAATQFNADDQGVALDSYSNKVTVTGLMDSTDYLYRVGDGKHWSETYAFTTHDPKSFGFFVVGDPQLGAKSTGPKTLDSDTAGWQETISKATAAYSRRRAFSFPWATRSTTTTVSRPRTPSTRPISAPSSSVHFPWPPSTAITTFRWASTTASTTTSPTSLRNTGSPTETTATTGSSTADVLFLMLNSNTESVATHDLFIRDAVAKNPKAQWRVVGFHHSVYSEADHYADPDIIDRRTNYPPVFERYKIDVVLQGHDHSYTRTFPMAKGKPVEGCDPKADSIVDPAGTVYFTFNSGSGSKFYDWKDSTPEIFSAVRWQGKVPSFSYIVRGSETSSRSQPTAPTICPSSIHTSIIKN